MDDRADVRPGAINFAMDEALEIDASIVTDKIAVQIERLDVAALDECGRHVPRQQEAIGAKRMAHAHVTERIEYALVRKNVIRIDQILDQLRIDGVVQFARHRMLSRQRPRAC